MFDSLVGRTVLVGIGKYGLVGGGMSLKEGFPNPMSGPVSLSVSPSYA